MGTSRDQREADPARRLLKPAKGLVYNPLRKYPPNRICFCGKGKKKFKKCCMAILAFAVSPADANKLEMFMAKVQKEIEAGR